MIGTSWCSIPSTAANDYWSFFFIEEVIENNTLARKASISIPYTALCDDIEGRNIIVLFEGVEATVKWK